MLSCIMFCMVIIVVIDNLFCYMEYLLDLFICSCCVEWGNCI